MNPFAYTDELIETVKAWDGTIGAPSARNRKTERMRVFKNNFVEDVLATSRWWLPGVWFGGFIAYGFYLAVVGDMGMAKGLGLYGAGILGWTFIEYALHRWAFHFHVEPDDFDAKMRLFLLHGYHHEFPNDKLRLVAPPMLSWPLAVIILGTYTLIGGLEPALILFGGTTCGYLFYDWTHYGTHHFRPKDPVFKLIRRSHMIHHYKLFQLNMGISTPLWDWILGSWGWSQDAVKEALAEDRKLAKERAAQQALTTDRE
ncbi:MAG: sterol desaturase family protein [Proteobacteria bacterium]|nr:sterol desaturase family protein [Pseudomonadota bacterium]